MENNNRRLVIKVSDNLNLVVEKNIDNDYKEFNIFLENSEGVVEQDLAVVGCDYTYNDNLEVQIIPDKFTAKIYGDENNEDYTNEFKINATDNIRVRNMIITSGDFRIPVGSDAVISIDNSLLAALIADFVKTFGWRVFYIHTPLNSAMPKNKDVRTYKVTTSKELQNKIKTLNEWYTIELFIDMMTPSPETNSINFRRYMPYTTMIGRNIMDDVNHETLVNKSVEYLQKRAFDYIFAEDLELIKISKFMNCCKGFLINKNKKEMAINDNEEILNFIHNLIDPKIK